MSEPKPDDFESIDVPNYKTSHLPEGWCPNLRPSPVDAQFDAAIPPTVTWEILTYSDWKRMVRGESN